jgi:tetratricopeptide (TPR) repeat protein
VRIYCLAFAALVGTAFNVAHAQCSPSIQKLVDDDKFDDAKAEVQALLAKNAKDDVALHCMGRIYVEMDKPGDAIGWFEKAVAASDKLSTHHLWLANALGAQAPHTNRLKLPFLARRVKSEFDKAVALDSSSIDARHGLIMFYSQAPGMLGGDMKKAKAQALEIGKLNAMRGHIEMAQLLESKDKDTVSAEAEFTAAIDAAPDSTAGYSGLAQFYRRHKRYPDAIAVYERLLNTKPDWVNAHLNIGYNLVLWGEDVDRAEREVKLWLSKPPQNAPLPNVSFAHYVLGMAYERQTKKDSARAEYQTAVAINPRNNDAKKALDALK